jgi:hypothetical protein
MSLSCALGLATCLSYMGTKIPDEDVFVIRYYCEEMGGLPTHSFLLHSGDSGADRRGYINADELERLGLNFRWKPEGSPLPEYSLASFRQRELLGACTEFNLIADSPSNWSS